MSVIQLKANIRVLILALIHLSLITLLYKVPSKITGKNFVTNVYCFYLYNF